MKRAVHPLKKPFPFHPFLFTLHPIFFLYAHNIYRTVLSAIYVPLAVSLGAVFAVLCIAVAAARSMAKGGIITALLVFFFFNYGIIVKLFTETPCYTVFNAAYSFRLEAGPVILGANKLFLAFGVMLITLALFLFIIKRKMVLPVWYAGVFFAVFGTGGFVFDRLLRELKPEHSFVTSLLSALFCTAVIAVIKSKLTFCNVTRFLNVASALLAGIVVFQITSYFVTQRVPPVKRSADDFVQNPNAVSPLPDVYYIILDAYGGNDVLQDYFNFSNSGLTGYFSRTGFYLADKSRSNYAFTSLSLTSSLNMSYVDEIAKDVDKKADGPAPIINTLRYNKAVRMFKEHSYTYVGISSNYEINDMCSADIHFTPPKRIYFYQLELVRSTFLGSLLALFDIHMPDLIDEIRRKSILHAFEVLKTLPESDSPQFVFAHILCPHSPFVFHKDGAKACYQGIAVTIEEREKQNQSRDVVVKAYTDQIQYLNTILMDALDTIIARSETPPVIIVQGDHGPQTMIDWNNLERSNVLERHSILNAYYVPDDVKEMLYPSISPVNSFRVLFNYLFDARFELLPDRSYFSPWFAPFQFTDVTERVKAE